MKIGYDGISCIQENKVTGGSEELIFHYVNGIRIDEVINMFHFFGASGAEWYYHYDGKGWVIALTDGDGINQTPGEVHRRYEYTPYGVTSIFTENYTAVSENDAFDVTDNGIAYNRTLYAGREYDPETNLYYYRARHYSPETGRFIQRDPIGYGDSACLMNRYCYCGCNPVNSRDPMGLQGMPGSSGGIGGGISKPNPWEYQEWEMKNDLLRDFERKRICSYGKAGRGNSWEYVGPWRPWGVLPNAKSGQGSFVGVQEFGGLFVYVRQFARKLQCCDGNECYKAVYELDTDYMIIDRGDKDSMKSPAISLSVDIPYMPEFNLGIDLGLPSMSVDFAILWKGAYSGEFASLASDEKDKEGKDFDGKVAIPDNYRLINAISVHCAPPFWQDQGFGPWPKEDMMGKVGGVDFSRLKKEDVMGRFSIK